MAPGNEKGRKSGEGRVTRTKGGGRHEGERDKRGEIEKKVERQRKRKWMEDNFRYTNPKSTE